MAACYGWIVLAAGTTLLDKYRIERAIGQGGMASVFAATHLQLNEPVAIKMLLPEMAQSPTVVQRFLREARAAVRLKGEHVTRVLDVGTLPSGAPYMVMELLSGVDLAQLLKEHGRMPAPDAVDYVLQVCEALAEAHTAGIVHRDIKPSNLFITRRPDGSPLVKVLDFGISKVAFEEQVSNLTMESVIGTPSYMSPEQLRGSASVDARTDIWSLGVVLYRMISGTRPFKADSLSALAIQAATEPTPALVGPYPPGIDAVVYRCLEKDAARRLQSVAELAYALAPYARDMRAATLVTERTQSILRWTPLPPPQTAHTAVLEPTTLGSSAGAVQPSGLARPRRAAWIIGAGIALGAILAIAVTTTEQADGSLPGRSGAPAESIAPAPSPPEPPLAVGSEAQPSAAPTEAAPSVAAPTEAAPDVAAPTEPATAVAAPTEAAPGGAAPTEAAPDVAGTAAEAAPGEQAEPTVAAPSSGSASATPPTPPPRVSRSKDRRNPPTPRSAKPASKPAPKPAPPSPPEPPKPKPRNPLGTRT